MTTEPSVPHLWLNLLRITLALGLGQPVVLYYYGGIRPGSLLLGFGLLYFVVLVILFTRHSRPAAYLAMLACLVPFHAGIVQVSSILLSRNYSRLTSVVLAAGFGVLQAAILLTALLYIRGTRIRAPTLKGRIAKVAFAIFLVVGYVQLWDMDVTHALTHDGRARWQFSAYLTLEKIHACAIQYQQESPGGRLPESLSEFGPERLNCLDDYVTDDGETTFYSIHYSVRPDGGTFWATARPLDYEERLLLSFFVDETGVVRYTPENRPADESDPPYAR